MARRSRTSSRHGHKGRRLTPRRWLPFLALIGLTAGAVVLIQNEGEPSTASSPASAAAVASRYLPVAAVPDALSTGWYCSGGTARGEGGPAELTVVIANEAPEGATAELTVVGAEGGPVTKEIAVPARGAERVVISELVTARWVGVSVEILGGHGAVSREVRGPTGFDASPCATSANDRWYVPSGSTVRGADAALLIYNPFPGPTSVDVSFATDAGPRTPRSLQGLSIPGESLVVVDSSQLPARRPEVATEVRARVGQVVVDRVQIYDGSGEALPNEREDGEPTPAPEGLASAAAIPTLAPRWLFPDVLLETDTRTQVGIFNPGDKDAEIDLVVTYEEPDLAPAVDPVAVRVRGGEQVVVDLNEEAQLTPDLPFTLEIRSLEGVPVAADLLLFGASPPVTSATDTGSGGSTEAPPGEEGAGDPEEAAVAPSPGFAVLAGSPVAATTWMLPQQWATNGRIGSIVVFNPGSSEVTVRVDEVANGNRTPVDGASVTVPARDRRSLDLQAAAAGPMLVVTADGPVVAAQRLVKSEGPGIAASLLMPWPETVTLLDPVP